MIEMLTRKNKNNAGTPQYLKIIWHDMVIIQHINWVKIYTETQILNKKIEYIVIYLIMVIFPTYRLVYRI